MQKRKPILPLLFVFIAINTFLLTSSAFFDNHGIDRDVLLVANTLFFLSNFVAFFLQSRALQNKNPNVFVRSMMASMMIKMLLVAGAFLVYILVAGTAVNKPAIYISIFLYFVYLAIEVAIIMKLNKQKNA
jgi:hypothetical protein